MHTTVKIKKDGKTLTKHIVRPEEVDQVVRDVWAQIRAGKLAIAESIIEKFKIKYAQHLHKASELKLEGSMWMNFVTLCGVPLSLLAAWMD